MRPWLVAFLGGWGLAALLLFGVPAAADLAGEWYVEQIPVPPGAWSEARHAYGGNGFSARGYVTATYAPDRNMTELVADMAVILEAHGWRMGSVEWHSDFHEPRARVHGEQEGRTALCEAYVDYYGTYGATEAVALRCQLVLRENILASGAPP